jgi:hypothetical protein
MTMTTKKRGSYDLLLSAKLLRVKSLLREMVQAEDADLTQAKGRNDRINRAEEEDAGVVVQEMGVGGVTRFNATNHPQWICHLNLGQDRKASGATWSLLKANVDTRARTSRSHSRFVARRLLDKYAASFPLFYAWTDPALNL